MGAMRAGLAVLAWGLLGASGCGAASAFACSDDEQCQAGGVAGQCEANGYCSFPDPTCSSGQRFGELAPSGVANECVEPEAGTGSTTQGASETGSDPSEGGEATSLASADSSTSLPLEDDGTSSTGPASSTGPSTDESTGATEDCTVSVVDEFDGMELDPMWSETVPSGASIVVQNGWLWLGVPPSMTWETTRVTTELGVLAGGWARVWIPEVADPDQPVTAGVGVISESCDLQMFASEHEVHAFVWDDEQQAGTLYGIEELPDLPIALQLTIDESGEVHFEHSQDGITWDSIANGSFPECGDLTRPVAAAVFSGGQSELPGLRVFERFEACMP